MTDLFLRSMTSECLKGISYSFLSGYNIKAKNIHFSEFVHNETILNTTAHSILGKKWALHKACLKILFDSSQNVTSPIWFYLPISLVVVLVWDPKLKSTDNVLLGTTSFGPSSGEVSKSLSLTFSAESSLASFSFLQSLVWGSVQFCLPLHPVGILLILLSLFTAYMFTVLCLLLQ